MSKAIEEKIVRMKLDNKDFESKAKSTVSIFGKLNDAFKKMKGADFKKSTDSLNELKNTADKTTLNKLVEGAQNAASRFSALGVIATTALVNIANRAVNAGLAMAKSFTVQPIMDGFGEYELKMGSIQTILANTAKQGTTLKDVSAALDDLNVYADKTIYNFAEMTRNIGYFTNAGIGLKESTSMIKGFSNEAAASGANSGQAANAAYQLSQALSAGTIRLMDWRSLTNASMGSKNMQNGLIEIAQAMGEFERAGSSAEDAQKDFNSSLESGWLSADVMSKYLQIMARDMSDAEMKQIGLNDAQIEAFKQQAANAEEAATKIRTWTQLIGTAMEGIGSGWGQTFELIFGDFEEATKLWSGVWNAIEPVINNMSDARNNWLRSFKDIGGIDLVFKTILEGGRAVVKIFNSMRDNFRKIFPGPKVGEVYDMVEKLRLVFMRLNHSISKNSETISKFFEAIFKSIKVVLKIAGELGKAFLNLIPKGMGNDIGNLVDKFLTWVISIEDAILSGKKFNNMMQSMQKFASGVGDVLGGAISLIGKGFRGLGAGLEVVWGYLGPILTKMGTALSNFIKSFTIKDVATGGFIAVITLLYKKLKNVGDLLGDFIEKFSGAFDKFTEKFGLFEELGNSLQALQTAVKATTLLQIAAAVGILAVSMKLLSTIKGQDLAKSVMGLAGAMLVLTKGFRAISKVGSGLKGALSASTTIIAIAGSVLVISAALKIFASMNAQELAKGMLALAGTVTVLVAAISALSKFGGKINTSSISLIALATSVVILASAVKKLSQIDAGGLAKGIVSLGVVFAELAVFLKVVDGVKFGMGSAMAVVLISAAIQVMVSAINRIAAIPVKGLVKGLTTIGLILTEIAIFTKVVSGSKVMGAATGMLVVAGAINALVGPIKSLGKTSLKELATGLIAMGVALAEVVLAMKLAQGAAGGAAGILMISVAMNAIVPPIKTLGSMSIGNLAKGLIAMAAAFGIMGVAAKLVGPMGAVVLLAFAAAIGAVGVAALAVAAAISAFAMALNVLASLSASAVTTIVTNLGQLIIGVLQMVPQFIGLAVDIVVAFAQGIAKAAPQLAASGLELILGLLTAMRDNIPQIITVASELITGFINALADQVGPLIDAGVNLIVQLVDGMANGIRDNQEKIISAVLNLVESLLEIIITALQEVITVLFGWIPGVEDATRNLGTSAKEALRSAFDIDTVASEKGSAFVNGVNSKSGEAGAAGTNVGTSAQQGMSAVDFGTIGLTKGSDFATGVGNQAGNAQSQGNALSNAGMGGANLPNWTPAGASKGSDFASGVQSKTSNARSSGLSLANAGKQGTDSADFSSSGRNAGEGFASGIASMADRVIGAARGIASAAKGIIDKVLNSHSPSRELIKRGQWFGQGLAIGIDEQQSNVKSSARSIAEGAVSAVNGVVGTINDALNDNLNLQPVITPVVDVSNIRDFDLSRTVNPAVNMINSSKVGVVDKVQFDNNMTLNRMMNKFDELKKEVVNLRALADRPLEANVMMDRHKVGELVADPVDSAITKRNNILKKINGGGR